MTKHEAPDDTSARKAPDPAQLARATALATAASDRQAEEVIALDVRDVTSLADTFLIASGRSRQHVRAIADAVLEAARRDGIRALGAEGLEEGRWALLDFGSVIFHVFHADARSQYDLERLWADAPQFDVEPVEVKPRKVKA
jgi:ribosome-associated protein